MSRAGVLAPSDSPPAAREPRRLSGLTGAAGLGVWVALVLGAWIWGGVINASGRPNMLVQAPPLTGHFWFPTRLWMLPVVALAILAVAFGPRVARSVPFMRLLLLGFAAAAAWAVALASTNGSHSLIGPVTDPLDYLHDLAKVVSPGAFLDSFTDRIGTYTTHVRSHPPGMLLVLWSLDAAGLSGPWWVAALEIAGGAAAVPAVLLAVREVAGEGRVREAAPFVVLAPAWVWVATSADALFMGVGAWAVALIVIATGRRDRGGDLAALGGGLLFGAGIFLSYGLVLLAVIPGAVALVRRRPRPVLIAATGAAAVVGAFGLAGFWWFEGLFATRRQYLEGISRHRSYVYFLIANLAAFAIALGPATMAGLARLRDRSVWLLSGGAIAAIALADLSGMSKGEVERIWLQFAPWVLIAGCSLAPSPRPRAWLAANAGVAILVQIAVRSPW